jgi:hypothetical protein
MTRFQQYPRAAKERLRLGTRQMRAEFRDDLVPLAFAQGDDESFTDAFE